MLVVLGLAVILLSLAVAAFNALTGNRSIEATKNTLASLLSEARLLSLNNSGQYTGVAVFPDPNNPSRCLAAIVKRNVNSTYDTDPYDNYKSYSNSFTYSQGQRVVFPTQYSDSNPGNKWFMAIFVRTNFSPGSVGNSPPVSVGPHTNANSFVNQYWSLYIPGDTDIVAGTDVQPLSAGVGVRMINDSYRVSGIPTGSRYVPLGVIFFDPQGHLTCMSYTITPGTNLGNAIGLTTYSYPGTTGLATLDSTTPLVYSDFGVAMYDITSFNNNSAALTGPYDTGNDTWIDSNGQVWTIDRFNGQLVTTP